MHAIKILVLILLLIMFPTGAGTMFSTSVPVVYYKAIEAKNEAIEAERLAAEQAEKDRIAAEEAEYARMHTYTDFGREELNGYAILQVPHSHFSINSNKSSDSRQVFSYLMDDDSYIEITCKDHISDNDIANAGCNICGMDSEPEHKDISSGNMTAIRLEQSEETPEGFKRISWCMYKDRSCLVVNGYINPSTDTVPFVESVESMLPKTNVYYISDYVMETPSTGYYKTDKFKEEFPDVVIENPEVTENEVVIDESDKFITWYNLKFRLDNDLIDIDNKTVDYFLKLGYHIDNAEVIGDIVKAGYRKTITMYKDDGVAIKLGVINNTDSALRTSALDITSLAIDVADFGFYTPNSKYNSEKLPDIVIFGGITWDSMADDIQKALAHGTDVARTTEPNGDFVISSLYSDENRQIDLVVVTNNYKDIKTIKFSITNNK